MCSVSDAFNKEVEQMKTLRQWNALRSQQASRDARLIPYENGQLGA